MDILETALDPWGRTVLTHVAWNIVWVSVFVFLTFLVAHASYIILSAHRVRPAAETAALEVKHPDLPRRVKRHTFMARLFHWVMAGSVFTLLGTAFFPIMGWQFDWVEIHYTAGLVLTGSIIYHILHTTLFLDFWSIWVGPKDIPEFKAEIMREAGHEVPGPHPAKYPIGNRLYHLVLTVVGCTSSLTGCLMLWRMGTPFINTNPYILGEGTWGWVYVFHGLAGLSLAGLGAAHIVFGARPKNWWLTRSMIRGSISRREYLQHHEPARWPIKTRKRTGQPQGLPLQGPADGHEATRPPG